MRTGVPPMRVETAPPEPTPVLLYAFRCLHPKRAGALLGNGGPPWGAGAATQVQKPETKDWLTIPVQKANLTDQDCTVGKPRTIPSPKRAKARSECKQRKAGNDIGAALGSAVQRATAGLWLLSQYLDPF